MHRKYPTFHCSQSPESPRSPELIWPWRSKTKTKGNLQVNQVREPHHRQTEAEDQPDGIVENRCRIYELARGDKIEQGVQGIARANQDGRAKPVHIRFFLKKGYSVAPLFLP